MSTLQGLWRVLDQQQRRQLVGLQLLSILMGISTVAGVAAALPFFTALSDPEAIRHSALLGRVLAFASVDDDRTLLIVLGAGFSAVVLIANAINLVGFLAIDRFAFRVGDALYVRLFAEYLHRDCWFHTRNNSSILATKVLHETTRVTLGILQQGLVLVTNLITVIFITASMLFINPVAAGATILGLGASYIAIYVLVRRRLLRNGQIVSAYAAARTRTVNESFAGIREVTLLQAREMLVGRFAQQSRAMSAARGNTAAISSSPRYVLESITVFCLAAVALYLRSHTGVDGPWIAQLTFVGFATYRLLPALQQSFVACVRIRADRPALAAIETDLMRAWRVSSGADAAVLDRTWQGRPRDEIRLREVSFRYAPDRPAAIAEVSLVIPAGAVIGVVGPNASGKTTLLDLICGLLTPQSGEVEVDGVRLGPANFAAWQSTIAYVPQHVFLFDATLAENIAFGTPAAHIDRERLEEAVRLARLTECVRSLPDGYDEMLGERGGRLSGGQRQRVALARALYRGASLLILDEATSSLDVASESEIVETLHSLRANRTILIIAHRAEALRHCDAVVELRHGRVVASANSGRIAALKTHAASGSS
jgi:HlyD family secretion protein